MPALTFNDLRPQMGMHYAENIAKLLYRGHTKEVGLLGPAARTATTSSAEQYNYEYRGLMVWIAVSIASGTGGLRVVLFGRDGPSGNQVQENLAIAAPITTTGTWAFLFHPSITVALNHSGSILQASSVILPKTYIVTVSHVDASSYTYVLTSCLIP